MTSSNTYWRVQAEFEKVKAHSFLEAPMGYNQDQMPLMNKVCYDLFNHLGSYRNTMQFQSSSRRKAGKEIPVKVLANNFALSDTECNTSGSMNRWGIADLPLLRILLTNCQSREPSFWEVTESFVLLAYVVLQLQEPLCNDY